MKIRLATEDDVEALLALFDVVANELVYIGTEPGYDRDLYRSRFLHSIARPERTPMFVATDAESLLGTLSIFEHPEYGATVAMMVAPEHRGRGIGRALLERAFEWARFFRVGHLSLLVFPHNERAVALYRSTGFEEIERYERDVTRRNGEVWDTMLMRKDVR